MKPETAGDGYRFLSNSELIQEGDDYYDKDVGWRPSGNAGITVAEATARYSFVRAYRRKASSERSDADVGEGYRRLTLGDFLRDGDEWKAIDNENDIFTRVNDLYSDHATKQQRTVADHKRCHGGNMVYRRKISEDRPVEQPKPTSADITLKDLENTLVTLHNDRKLQAEHHLDALEGTVEKALEKATERIVRAIVWMGKRMQNDDRSPHDCRSMVNVIMNEDHW